MIVFVAAVVLSLLMRVLRVARPIAVDSLQTKVLVCVRADHSSNFLWEWLQRARRPGGIQICVMVECTAPDAEWTVDSQLLRHQVRIEHVVHRAPRPYGKLLHKIARRFVLGDEECIVLLHPDARVVQGWDATIAHLRATLPVDHVLSAPTAAADGSARFPTLRTRSTGAIARDTSRAFPRLAMDAQTVPAVCACGEVLALHARTPTAWLCDSTWVPPSAPTVCHVLPTTPLLEADDALEERLLDADEGRDGRPKLTSREEIGLTAAADDREKILKFGSTRNADLLAHS